MNKHVFVIFTAMLGFIFVIGGASFVCAQEGGIEEFTLEEITVTAEKREVNVQQIPASVQALVGANLMEQGKITTKQILEDVPNVTYRLGSDTNPNGNITIRGIQRTQESSGTNSVLPSTTATYTDGVYQGIGGNYDVERVEILRGPQGTLYGRSATGGVVAFHTKDPIVEEFSVDAFAEFGEANLRNFQAAVNVPVADFLALRAAGHRYEQAGYFNADGDKTKTEEGRIKVLFQPNDDLEMVFSLSTEKRIKNSGGWESILTAPDVIDYRANYSDVTEGSPHKYRQGSLNIDYDFGNSTVTYVGGYHDYDNTGLGDQGYGADGMNLHIDQTEWPEDYYISHEIRWASDTEGQFAWLVGANYFKHKYSTSRMSYQIDWNPADPELDETRDYWSPIFGQDAMGTFENYGIFTEETFELQDDFRITAGLRYDKTDLVQDMYWKMNVNLSAMMNNINPPIWNIPNPLVNNSHKYDNFTYKLRFEYDITPDNMIYALTSTGFMPGYVGLSPSIGMGPAGIEISWNIMQFDEQKLTSYEVGSKNQFMNNTLRLNGAVFYYDYEGYPEAVPVAYMGPSPVFAMFAVPLEMIGVEVSAEYLITMNDKISLNAGWLDAEISEFTIAQRDGVNYNSSLFMALPELPGNPDLTTTLAYEHIFTFADGSALVPRAEVRLIGDYYLEQMSQEEVDSGLKPYNYQGAYTVVNIGATWTSANEMFSLTGYVRNLLDEEYKTQIQLSSLEVTTPGDPLAWGLVFRARF